ncbi:hypothetical protein BGZ93_003974, partial [Podila epicladia]
QQQQQQQAQQGLQNHPGVAQNSIQSPHTVHMQSPHPQHQQLQQPGTVSRHASPQFTAAQANQPGDPSLVSNHIQKSQQAQIRGQGMMSPVQKSQLLKQQVQQQAQQAQQQQMIAQQQLAHQQQMMQRQQLQQAQQLQQQQHQQQTGLPPQLSQDRKQKVQQMGARGPGIQVHDARTAVMNDIQHKANNQEF